MTSNSLLWLAAVPVALVFGCSGSDTTSQAGAGGNMALGGAVGAGGVRNSGGAGGSSANVGGLGNSSGGHSTGGAFATGGANATGGASPTGGAPAAGGTVAAGGKSSTGGTNPTGGTKATGGTSASGGSGQTAGTKATGGSGPSGGTNATGGTKASSGGTSSIGGANSGGAATGGAAGSSSTASPGCGIASPLKTGNFTESIGGTSRKWMLDVPTGYDASKPYRLIFVWHPLGGSGSGVVSGGFNGLKSLANNTAVFATADGLSGSNGEASGTGWWNASGGDMKLVQVMLDKINAGLCIDQTRIFSTGFSFGGMMSYTLPFEFDVFRAVAPCSGKTGVIPYQAKFNRPVPIMAFHGNNDTFVATSLGKAFFDSYRTTRNHCGTQTQPVDPSPCVQYQGCDEVSIWCEFSGAHETWSQEPQAIWKFFSQY